MGDVFLLVMLRAHHVGYTGRFVVVVGRVVVEVV